MSGGIAGGVVSGSITTSNGTYVHPDGTTEQNVVEIVNNLNLVTITFDVSLLVQNTTVRVYEKTDGSNYELVDQAVFPTGFSTNVENIVFELNGKNRDQKITFQSGTGEGTTRDVPFSRVNVLRTA